MHKQEHNAVTGSNCLTFMNENEISSRSSGLKDVDISDPGAFLNKNKLSNLISLPVFPNQESVGLHCLEYLLVKFFSS